MGRLFGLLVTIFCLAGSAVAAPRATTIGSALAIRTAHRPPMCQASPRGSGELYDGDLQLMPDIGSNYTEYFAGEPFAPGWRVTKGSVTFNGSTHWGPPAPRNACTIDLDGAGPGAIRSRPFSTTPNKPYVVIFLFSASDAGEPLTKELLVEAAGQTRELDWVLWGNASAQEGAYLDESWTFTATGRSTSIRFISRDPRGSTAGPVIGDISVAPK